MNQLANPANRLHLLMGSGKILEQHVGPEILAVATFGNYSLLQLELKAFFHQKKTGGRKEAAEQLTNHT